MDRKTPFLPPPPLLLGGIQVMQSDLLPKNTMMVSPDVYKLLTATPEQHEQSLSSFKKTVDDFQALLKAKGLSPTGRKLSEPE